MNKSLQSLFFVLCISFTVNHSFAQIDKGTKLVGGSLYYSSQATKTDNSDQKVSRFGISPSLGIAVKENLILGANLNFGTEDYKNYRKMNDYGIGIFARKYQSLGKGFFLFAEGEVAGSYGNGKRLYSSSTTMGKEQRVSVTMGITPGISYAVRPGLHIETSLSNLLYAGYYHSKLKDGAQVVERNSAVNAGLSLGRQEQWNIGLRFLLACK